MAAVAVVAPVAVVALVAVMAAVAVVAPVATGRRGDPLFEPFDLELHRTDLTVKGIRVV